MATEEEERHEREVVTEQEQQQMLMEQLDQKLQKPEEDASSAPLLAGQLQTVAEVQIQEKFRVAVVTTDRFRAQQRESWHRFLDTQLRWIINKRQGEAPQYQLPGEASSQHSASSSGNDVDSDFGLEFEVLVTGGTYLEIMEHFKQSVAQRRMSSQEFDAVRRRVQRLPEKTHGIVQVTFELVEGRLGAVFHLCDYKDINGSHASGVLRRQSMVHNVPYADSLHGAEAICISWWRSFQVDSRPLAIRSSTPFPTAFSSKPSGGAAPKQKKKKEKLPATRAGNVLKLKDLERHSKSSSDRMVMDGIVTCTDYNNNIALIAHDGKKLELCCLALENIQKLLRFDRILCTGTTGGWLKRFFTATLDSISNASGMLPFPVNLEEKLIICESGPKGGDVQIAFACLSGYCSRVIFLIDPMEAHPHEVDIRFFEQAVESSPKYPVHVATNVESALYLLSSLRDD